MQGGMIEVELGIAGQDDELGRRRLSADFLTPCEQTLTLGQWKVVAKLGLVAQDLTGRDDRIRACPGKAKDEAVGVTSRGPSFDAKHAESVVRLRGGDDLDDAQGGSKIDGTIQIAQRVVNGLQRHRAHPTTPSVSDV